MRNIVELTEDQVLDVRGGVVLPKDFLPQIPVEMIKDSQDTQNMHKFLDLLKKFDPKKLPLWV